MGLDSEFDTLRAGARRGDGNVKDLMGPRMMRKSPVLEEGWRYWSSLRHDGALPRRADLNAASMSLIMGHALILDRVRPGTVRVRVSGRVANDLMGMETRGLPIRAFFDLLQRSRAVELVDRVFAETSTLELDLISEGIDGPVAARMVILPMADDAGETTKALALLVPDRVVTDGPRRFSILRHHVGPLSDLRAAAPQESPAPAPLPATAPVSAQTERRKAVDYATPHAAPLHAAAEAPAEFAETNVPWLRIVK